MTGCCRASRRCWGWTLSWPALWPQGMRPVDTIIARSRSGGALKREEYATRRYPRQSNERGDKQEKRPPHGKEPLFDNSPTRGMDTMVGTSGFEPPTP
jgi:hypothetical protein